MTIISNPPDQPNMLAASAGSQTTPLYKLKHRSSLLLPCYHVNACRSKKACRATMVRNYTLYIRTWRYQPLFLTSLSLFPGRSCLNARNKRQEAVKLHRYGCTSHQVRTHFYFPSIYNILSITIASGMFVWILLFWSLIPSTKDTMQIRIKTFSSCGPYDTISDLFSQWNWAGMVYNWTYFVKHPIPTVTMLYRSGLVTEHLSTLLMYQTA